MDLTFSGKDEEFRRELREFLESELPLELKEYTRRMTSVYSEKSVALQWQDILARKGWAAPSWPLEYGGCDWSVAQKYLFDVELARAEAPPLSPMGISMCAPALIGFGTEAQKDYYLPRMLSGEDYWCQGYSEPHAGSDLASLSMTAERCGDEFICNGSKLWTTHAHEANMMFCLVRTSQEARPQLGITFLLIEMDSPGVTVSPIAMLTGEHIQNAVFFDDVRVPVSNVVGEIGNGWTVAKYLLEFERGGSAYTPKLNSRVRGLRRAAIDNDALTPDISASLSEVEISISALEIQELRLMSELSKGGSPGLIASLLKIRGTELSQRLTEIRLSIAGNYAAPFQPEFTAPGGEVINRYSIPGERVGPEAFVTAMPHYLNDRVGSIYAGSNEIQRNILAKILISKS